MKIVQIDNLYLDFDKVTAIKFDVGKIEEDKKLIEVIQLTAILDSGVGLPIKVCKDIGEAKAFIIQHFKEPKKGIFTK